MAVSGSISLPLLRTFDSFRRKFGGPKVFVVPKEQAGLTYDPDVDAWVDGDGDVVTKEPAELGYYEVPALWGADAGRMVLAMGGILGAGDVVAIAKAEYRARFDDVLEVVTGSLYGTRYHLAGLENAPDGDAGVFVVAQLRRR